MLNSENKESSVDVYRKLQQHLDTLPTGFPPTESGVELRLLKRLFTEEEAKIASGLKFGIQKLEPLNNIYSRLKSLGYTKAELENQLDLMAKKGLILAKKDDGIKTYANAMLIVGIFEFQVDKLTEGFVQDLAQYVKEKWGLENAKLRIDQLRTIPVGINIEHSISISNYDDIKQLIKKMDGPYMVANCVCRQAKDLIGEPCSTTSRRELCLGFGYGAQLYIENGWGREITKDEAINILKKNEEEGLIFQTDNSEDGIIICSCCSCCCIGISRLKKSPYPSKVCTSNYYAKLNPDLCNECEICIERCPMDAISLGNSKVIINEDRCIGCGNCVVSCEFQAISLQKRTRKHVPFKTLEELYNSILERRKVLETREKKRLLRTKNM